MIILKSYSIVVIDEINVLLPLCKAVSEKIILFVSGVDLFGHDSLLKMFLKIYRYIVKKNHKQANIFNQTRA